MSGNTDLILDTLRVIFSSDKPVSTGQIATRSNISRRTVQRHIERLSSAGLVTVERNKHNPLEHVCYKAI